MDFTDIGKVNTLYAEQKSIQRVLEIFADGGRITQVGVSPAAGADPSVVPPAMVVGTEYMTYPPQMVDAIRSGLETRQQEIADELAQLGVTGVPQPPSR